jgi:hypothetical protein
MAAGPFKPRVGAHQPEAAIGKLTVKEALADVANDYTTKRQEVAQGRAAQDSAAPAAVLRRARVDTGGSYGMGVALGTLAALGTAR